LVYNEVQDPLLHEKLDWHLTPQMDWDNLNKIFPVFQPMDPHHWNTHNGHEIWTLTTVFISGFALVGLVVAFKRILGCFRNGRKNSGGQKPNKAKKPKDEVDCLDQPQPEEDSNSEISIRG